MNKVKDKQAYRLLHWLKWLVGLFFVAYVLHALRSTSWSELTYQLKDLWYTQNRFYLLAVLFIWPLNILIDALKWRVLLGTQYQVSFSVAVRAVLSGKTAGVLTPAMLGDFAGRLYYLPRQSHLRAIWATLYSGFLTQVLLWCLSIMVLPIWLTHRFLIILEPSMWFAMVLAISALLFVVLYRLPLLFKWLSSFGWVPQILRETAWLDRFGNGIVVWVAILSVVRLGLNILQLILLWWFFKLDISFEFGFVLALLIFGMQGLLPGFILTDLGIRGGIALFMLAPYADFAWQQVFPSYLLWLLNVLFTASLGWLSLLLFKRQALEQVNSAIDRAVGND